MATKGRPPKYDEARLEEVTNYCLLGATDEELAVFLDISVATLYRYKAKYPAFCEAIKAGKEKADAQVVASLHGQALDGNTTAAIFWLKNRRSQHWRDKVDHQHSGNVTLGITEDEADGI